MRSGLGWLGIGAGGGCCEHCDESWVLGAMELVMTVLSSENKMIRSIISQGII
jgi:hypothetical protein